METKYIILLLNGVVSGIFAFLSYNFSIKKYDKNILDAKIDTLQKSLDQCFDETALFIEEYQNKNNQTIEKRIAIESLDYKIEKIRLNIDSYSMNFKLKFGSIGVLISDLMYENDIHQCLKNLVKIKNLMITLKTLLEEKR